ncbi:MAG: electron transfer flavoprotein subunit alpha/FixB family protein [Elusimicrobia bacterium]|nr:electron transfer flavoprotein subunit alpha/FixB family protein [Elusimicrobiota bacterium]
MANGILVVIVPQRGTLSSSAYELLGAGRQMADALKQPLTACVIGASAKTHAADIAARGADKALAVEHPCLANFIEESYAKAAAQAAAQSGASRVILASTVAGRALAARLAVTLKAGLATDVAEILPDGRVRRAYYSGNLVAEVELKSPVAVLTIAPMTFPRAEPKGSPAPVEALAFDPGASKSEFVSFQAEQSREIDLGAAEKVVSGGFGLGGPDGFKLVFDLAHALGAAVGASRRAVDSGWIPYRHQVGLTGRTVRPKLYVAVGISGQIQHLAGMSSSGTIVAINTDKDCPLMQMASISVQGEYAELVPKIVEEIKRRKGAVPAAA